MTEDKNGWRLVGKIALVVLIPTLGGAAWVGALGETVKNQGGKITTLESKMDTRAERQAEILAKLEDIKERLSEMRQNRWTR